MVKEEWICMSCGRKTAGEYQSSHCLDCGANAKELYTLETSTTILVKEFQITFIEKNEPPAPVPALSP